MSTLKYIATAHHSSSVLFALRCDFREPGIDDLVICKRDRIEIYALEPSELKLVHTSAFYGNIISIQTIKSSTQSKSSLLVLTAPTLQLFELSFSPSERGNIVTTISRNLQERGRREALGNQSVLIDPRGRCAAAHVYEGEVQIFPSPTSASKRFRFDLQKAWSSKLSYLNIHKLCLLSLSDRNNPVLAYIHSDQDSYKVLRTRTVNLSQKEFSDGPLKQLKLGFPEIGAIIAVKSPASDYKHDEGLLLAGENKITYVCLSNSKGKTREEDGEEIPEPVHASIPIGEYTALCVIDEEPDHFLLGDTYGLLQIVCLVRSANGKVIEITVTEAGKVSSTQSLVYLANNYLFVGSHFGDSQLVKVSFNENGPSDVEMVSDDSVNHVGSVQCGKVQPISNFTNLAPISDFVIVETGNFGSNLLVTCSGAMMDGRLSLVRHGVGLSHLATLDLERAQRVWCLKFNGTTQMYDDVLAISFVDGTTFLRFGEDEGIDDVSDSLEFRTDISTLEAGNIKESCVQVTNDGVYLNGVGKVWSDSERKTTLAAIQDNYIVLALEDCQLVLLEFQGKICQEIRRFKVPNEVSSLAILIKPTFLTLAVGLWSSQTILFFSLPSLTLNENQTPIAISSTFLLRSLSFITFSEDNITHLFAGLGDGTLLNFTVDDKTGLVLETSRKSIRVGNKPISMHIFKGSDDSQTSLFVSSDKPTVVTRIGGRLNYASVDMQTVQAHTHINNRSFPNATVFTSLSGIHIGKIADVQKLHIKTLSFSGEQPRRIAYNKELDVFGVVCLKANLDRQTGEERTASSIKILNGSTFETLEDIQLEENEEGYSIESGRWNDGSPCFFIGTGSLKRGDKEAKKGRVLVLIKGEEKYEQIGAQHTMGAVYSMVVLDGYRLAAAINSSVVLYSFEEATSMKLLSVWANCFLAYSLISPTPSTLLVADAFRSVILLEIEEKTQELVERGREYNANAMMSIEALPATSPTKEETGNASYYIGAEQELNIFTVERQSCPGEGGQELLESRGLFHLGDLVNQIRIGSLDSSTITTNLESGVAIAKVSLIYGTSSGALGVICDLEKEVALVLSDLERNMRNAAVGVGLGNLDQVEWRTFRSAHRVLPPVGFIDGGFVEMFLDLSEEEATSVLQGRNEHEKIHKSYEDIVRILDELVRLH